MNVLSVGAAAYLKPALQVAPLKTTDRENDSDGDDAAPAAGPTMAPDALPAIGSTVDVRA